MDSAALGKRIKEARLSKKMTQSEVVGTFITRNMLSQIESGVATPSVRTLEYLCGVLDLPIDQLLGEPADDALSQLTRVKALLAMGEYSKIIAMDRKFPKELSDEYDAILARAYLERAKELEKTARIAEETGGNANGAESGGGAGEGSRIRDAAALVAAEGLREAAEMAKKAMMYADLGIYANAGWKAESMMLLNQAAEQLSKYYLSLSKQ